MNCSWIGLECIKVLYPLHECTEVLAIIIRPRNMCLLNHHMNHECSLERKCVKHATLQLQLYNNCTTQVAAPIFAMVTPLKFNGLCDLNCLRHAIWIESSSSKQCPIYNGVGHMNSGLWQNFMPAVNLSNAILLLYLGLESIVKTRGAGLNYYIHFFPFFFR